MKRRLFCLLLTVALLLLGTAMADELGHFYAQLPEGSYINGDAVLDEGDHLILMAYNSGTWRVNLTTGECEQIARESNTSANGTLCRDAEGTLCLIGTMYDDNWNQLLGVQKLDEEKGQWYTAQQKSLDDLLDGAALEYMHSSCYDNGTLYMLLTIEGKDHPMLASWTLATDEVKLLAALGGDPWSSGNLFLRGQTVCNADNIYDENGLIIYTYDLTTGESGTETYYGDQLSIWTAEDIQYQDGQYTLICRTNDSRNSRGIYTGQSLESLTLLADSIGESTTLIATQKGMLLLDSNLIMSASVFSDAAVTLVVNDGWSQDSSYLLQSGVNVVNTYLDVAEVLNTKNSDVDIFCIRTTSTPGLSLIKSKGYFVDLSSSEIISGQVQRLYQGLQKGLMTDDGRIVGWYMTVETFLPDAMNATLKENDMEFPTTLLQMFQQIVELDERGVFTDEMMSPMGYPSYERQEMLEMCIERYLNEQQLLGNRINLDNAELRELLEYIVAHVPEERNDYGDEYGENTLFEMQVGMSITADCNMPLKIGESSPNTIPAEAYVMVINPYSKHQAEAIQYLEYCSQHMDNDTNYRIFTDMTEPLLNSSTVKRIESCKEQIAALETQEQTAEVKDQLAELREDLERMETYKYTISAEDIAAWQQVAPSIVVPEENFFSDDLTKLIQRLSQGNLTVDGFIQEGNRYFNMLYQERGE